MSGATKKTTSVPRRPQARGLATRERLITAAEYLFARQGYEGTSIGDVARKAGVGVGTVYHHFVDKRAVLLELIDRWGDRLEAERQSEEELERFLGRDARQAIRRWLVAAYENLRESPSLYLVARAAADGDPELSRRYRRIEELGIERARRLVQVGQWRGLLRTDIDAAAAAFLIQHTVEAMASQLMVRKPEDQDPDVIVGELADMIGRYVVRDDADPPGDP
jgi:AcrR family transcriptional regulator